MKFFKKGSAILIAGIMLLSCTACSGLEKLADGLKSGANYIGLYGADYDGIIRITVE